MNSRSRLILGILLCTLIALGAGGYAYWFFLIRGPLAGETKFDFGDVPLHAETASLQHTLLLRNRLSRPLAIEAIRPDCGCVTVAGGPRTLAPGEAFGLPITFIAKSGSRTVLIDVLFADGATQTLHVTANGEPQPRLWMPPEQTTVALNTDGMAEIVLRAATYGQYDEPAQPEVTTEVAGLSSEFLGWSLKGRPKDVTLAPTNWEGVMRVRFAGESLPENATITMAIPSAQPVTVPVTR